MSTSWDVSFDAAKQSAAAVARNRVHFVYLGKGVLLHRRITRLEALKLDSHIGFCARAPLGSKVKFSFHTCFLVPSVRECTDMETFKDYSSSLAGDVKRLGKGWCHVIRLLSRPDVV
ncbi:hypothetical protein JMJ77_0014236 [Colletotrichum scovillei]|uniref:Uncharacterized protein n=1 Tax=Colletotrichum scovillei TaxID=1209932 RepID=A0A9P7R5J6_9PEZI|nr:hypothetical protein JMJ77_0014236 [Colletotrichum scovillei]KAG7068366.1 hypothetical protein JMJ76_0008056 [Colletotrichum scovillei]